MTNILEVFWYQNYSGFAKISRFILYFTTLYIIKALLLKSVMNQVVVKMRMLFCDYHKHSEKVI